MKKFLMIMIMFSSLNVFAGGNRPCSEKYETRITTVAKSTAFVLNCENKAEVRVSVARLAKRLRLCTSQKGIVCSLAGKGAAYLVRKQIPVKWECNPTIAMAGLSFAVSKACTAITGL
jgi:hypothetical protein